MVDTPGPKAVNGSSSSLSSTHPQYDCRVKQWERCRDTLAGQDAIKSRNGGMCYLPPTAGMILDGMNGAHDLGYQNYQAYLSRSFYYGFVAEGVDLALGMLWNKPPLIEGIKGTPLEYLETRATHEGESLERLLYRINEAQISTGRIGIFADMPAGETAGTPQPYISLYNEYSIINWDSSFTGELSNETLNLVVLDESGPKRINTFQWEDWTQYRVLALGPIDSNEQFGVYNQGVFASDGVAPVFDQDLMFAPVLQGRTLNEIPFVFINANSTTSCPQDPPLLSLADATLYLYRLQADYSAELHGQTSATLITKGLTKTPKDEKKPQRLGVGGHVDLGSGKDSDAWFLELSGKGLPELRQAVESAKELCKSRAGEVVDQSSRGRESGNSLEQRISVRTATLHSIAQHGAEGLQKLLRIIARWLGMSDEQISKIKIRANTVFSRNRISGTDFKLLCESKLLGGAIIPYQALHNYLVQNAFTELPFEEFVKQWEEEKDLIQKMQEQIAEGEKMKEPDPVPGPAPDQLTTKGPAPVVTRPSSTGT